MCALPICSRISQYDEVRQALLAQALHRDRRARHLHERHDAFLHARTAGSCKQYERRLLLDCAHHAGNDRLAGRHAEPKDKVKEHCLNYEKQIEDAGGLDLQILGIGVNGHIGFNEPGSGIYSKTRLITLDNSTRIANAYEFGNMSQVPRMAITMGISTILRSKKIILMAWGQNKAPVVKKSVEEDDTEDVPASLLQNHDDCTFVIDETGAAELTRFKSPWLTGECEWTDAMMKRAVVNLALKLNKPVLSLTNNDYNDNGLSDLLVEKGDAYEINLQVFYLLRDIITGWPGGKQTEQRTNHP